MFVFHIALTLSQVLPCDVSLEDIQCLSHNSLSVMG